MVNSGVVTTSSCKAIAWPIIIAYCTQQDVYSQNSRYVKTYIVENRAKPAAAVNPFGQCVKACANGYLRSKAEDCSRNRKLWNGSTWCSTLFDCRLLLLRPYKRIIHLRAPIWKTDRGYHVSQVEVYLTNNRTDSRRLRK